MSFDGQNQKYPWVAPIACYRGAEGTGGHYAVLLRLRRPDSKLSGPPDYRFCSSKFIRLHVPTWYAMMALERAIYRRSRSAYIGIKQPKNHRGIP
jgi:hypothetical protein